MFWQLPGVLLLMPWLLRSIKRQVFSRHFFDDERFLFFTASHFCFLAALPLFYICYRLSLLNANHLYCHCIALSRCRLFFSLTCLFFAILLVPLLVPSNPIIFLFTHLILVYPWWFRLCLRFSCIIIHLSFIPICPFLPTLSTSFCATFSCIPFYPTSNP